MGAWAPKGLAWGYFGKFYYGSDTLGAYRYGSFSAARSGAGHTLRWNAAPKYYLLTLTSASYPTDFAVTTGSTLNSFINYGAFSYFKYLPKQFGAMSIRPGAAAYGIGARNQQANTNRTNVDYFRSYAYTTHSLYDYVGGTNPRRYRGQYNRQAWVRAGYLGGGTVAFSLNENPAKTQDRKFVHSFSIPRETKAGTYRRYMWHTLNTFSASVKSEFYIIKPNNYARFIGGGSFQYYASAINTNAYQELRLPAGNYYVVAVNGMNTNTLHAGSGVSMIHYYK